MLLDRNDILQIQVVTPPEKVFRSFIGYYQSSSPYCFLFPNSFSQLLLLSFFFYLAHYDRQQCLLAGTGGFSRQKISLS